MLEACIFGKYDRYGNPNPHAGKVICLKPAGAEWGPGETGAFPGNTVIVKLPDLPVRLVQAVAQSRDGLVTYPFARTDAQGDIIDLSMVRVKADDAVAGRQVSFAEMTGAGTWLALQTP